MTFFFYVAILLAIADWIAISRQALSIRWFTKTGTILALLLWFSTVTPVANEPRSMAFTLALCFSLIGDIFLLMEGPHMIKGGMAFFLAHAAFIAAYVLGMPLPPIFFGLLLLTGISSYFLYRPITHAILRTGDRDYAIGVWLYVAILTAMTSSALTTLFRDTWQLIPSLLTAIGALLFYVSDILLFQNRIYEATPRRTLITTVGYYLAQFALTYSFAWYLFTTR
jgi:uncharacterized membrane protein YhhN